MQNRSLLEQRISILERQNRRIIIAGTVLLIILMASLAVHCGIREGSVLKVERLSLVDLHDRTRAFFGILDREPTLIMYDRAGAKRIEIGMLEGGWPKLSFHRSVEETDQLELLVGPERSELLLRDKAGKATLTLMADGSRRLEFLDSENRLMTGFRIDPEGNPRLTMLDGEGRVLFDRPSPPKK